LVSSKKIFSKNIFHIKNSANVADIFQMHFIHFFPINIITIFDMKYILLFFSMHMASSEAKIKGRGL